MAGENYDTTIKVALDADLAGGIKTEKQLDAIRKKAKDLGKEGADAAGKATSAMGRLQQATGKLRQALAGFGVAGLFSALIAQVGKIAESFGAAKKQAEEFAKIQGKLAEEKGVRELAADYERLKDAVSAAGAEQTHALEMIDEDVKNRRRLEKAQRGAAKEEDRDAWRAKRDKALETAKDARAKEKAENRAAEDAEARAGRTAAFAAAAAPAADAERQRVRNAAARRKEENERRKEEDERRKEEDERRTRRAKEDAQLDLEEQKKLAGAKTERERTDIGRAFARRRAEIAGERAKEDGDEAAGIAAQAALLKDDDSAAQAARRADRRPDALTATDRLAQMGGFSTAGAASVTGVSAGSSPELAEMKRLSANAERLLEELRAINRNTRGERTAVFG